jgi:DNA-binding response OmpR family regulator
MSKRVLLIDDEEEFVSTLSERLVLRGFDCRFATSGEAGLAMIPEFAPEVVVLDVIMPGVSGFDLLALMRKEYPDTPVILLTGHGSTQDGMKGMEMGAFDYLIKPVDIEELVSKIQSSLKGER